VKPGYHRSPDERPAEKAIERLPVHLPARRPRAFGRIVQLLVERVDVQAAALEVRIRAEGLASLVGELRQQGERIAA
jgi:hypothetical protein